MTQQTTPAFNLLDEPWIPVRTLKGEVLDVGLTDALLRAGEFRELAETEPPNLVAIYRLLLAVLYRALITHHGRWRDADRARWFREGLPEAPIREYLREWRDAFWLFHPERPFMQVAALATAEETKDKLKPWTQISIGSATGNAAVVFDHAIDQAPATISAAFACRCLLGFLQFTPGGLVKTFRDSDKMGPLANTAAVLPIGRNVAESLLLSLHPFNDDVDDLASWEKAAPTIEDLRDSPRLATGPIDRYTRLTRAVLVCPEDTYRGIRRVRFGCGLALLEDDNAPDPMASYRLSQDARLVRVSFHEGRAIWRDLPSLVPDVGRTTAQPPSILEWAGGISAAMGNVDLPVEILIAGVSSDQAKLLRWRIEKLLLPYSFLVDGDRATELREQVRVAEDVFRTLKRICVDLLAASMPSPDHKETKARARSLIEAAPIDAAFFSAAERGLPELLEGLAGREPHAAIAAWQRTLRRAAESGWRAGTDLVGHSPRAFCAVARTAPRFGGLLRSLEGQTMNSHEAMREQPV